MSASALSASVEVSVACAGVSATSGVLLGLVGSISRLQSRSAISRAPSSSTHSRGNSKSERRRWDVISVAGLRIRAILRSLSDTLRPGIGGPWAKKCARCWICLATLRMSALAPELGFSTEAVSMMRCKSNSVGFSSCGSKSGSLTVVTMW